MKKSLIWVALTSLTLVGPMGCQQVPISTAGGDGFNDIETGKFAEWCNGVTGDLSCWIETPEGDGVIGEDPNAGLYSSCMDSCTSSNADCEASCLMTALAGTATMPESDPIFLPEPAKAVKVTVRGCYSLNVDHEMILQGNYVGFRTIPQGPRTPQPLKFWENYGLELLDLLSGFFLDVDTIFAADTVNLGYEVGRDPLCHEVDDNLANNVQVTFEPVTDTSVPIGEGRDVVPFTGLDSTYTLDAKFAAATGFGLPAAIRESAEIDLTEMKWVLKKVSAEDPTNVDGVMGFGWYDNNLAYGKSVLVRNMYRNKKDDPTPAIGISEFYLFVKSN